MRLLLDTHVFLWTAAGSRALTPSARRVIQAADRVYVSAASIWEIAIKAALGKLDADADELAAAITLCGFDELPVSAAHAAAVERLAPHHSDPFDRLLIAQATTEPLRLLTADTALTRYSDVVQLI